jgi:hypothetical protein
LRDLDDDSRTRRLTIAAGRIFGMLTGERALGRGEFQVTVRNAGGERSSPKVMVNDTRAGRYLLTTANGEITVRGADYQVLQRQLDAECRALLSDWRGSANPWS